MVPTDAQQIIDVKIAARRATLRELRTRRNAHTAIAKLPVELFSKIFILSKLSRPHGWLNVAAVCRKWREIVLNTPRLWTDLNVARIRGIHWAVAVLARSKNAPLHVHGSYNDPAILRAVFAHIARIQDLRLEDSYSLLMEVFSSAPRTLPTQLRVLHLENQRYRSPSTTGGLMHKVFDLSMPFLRDLAICELALPPDIPLMPQLRRLRVSSAATSCETPLSTLLAFLRSTPSLEELEIENSLTSGAGASDFPEVHLPRLSWVSLLSAHPDNACLFRYIQYPPSSRVQYHCTQIHSASVLLPMVAAIESHFASSGVAAKMDKVAFINSGSAHFHLQGFVGEITSIDIEIGISTRDVLEAFRLHAALPSSNVQTLVLGGPFAAIERTDWSNLFTHFQHVRALVLENVPGELFSMLKRLHETDTQISLPKLKNILLRECSFDGRHADFSLAGSMLEFFYDRDELGKPVETLEIQDCRIIGYTVAELSDVVYTKWDHKSLPRDEHIARYGYGLDDFDPWEMFRW